MRATSFFAAALALAALPDVPAFADTSAPARVVQEVASLKGYWRLLAAEGDHVYVAPQGHCFQELSLQTHALRPVVRKCPSGETTKLVLGGKNFYWSQSRASDQGQRRPNARLYACAKDGCAAHELAPKAPAELTALSYEDGNLYASFSPASGRVGPSMLVRIPDETGQMNTIVQSEASILGIAADANDVYYYLDDPSDAIWRMPLVGNGRPEVVVRNAGNSQLLAAKSHEAATEVERLPSLGHPRVHDFREILGVGGDRLYWRTRLIHWYSMSRRDAGVVTDENGRAVDAVGFVVARWDQFFVTDDHLDSIQAVPRSGGHPQGVVSGQSRIAGLLWADGYLTWSVYSAETRTTVIRRTSPIPDRG